MAIGQVSVTLSGTTQITTTRIPVQQVIIHNPTGNGSITIGTSAMDATNYGFLVAAGANSPPIGPFSAAAPLNLNELYLRGTDAQVVRVFYISH
jgi:hypothetical protein